MGVSSIMLSTLIVWSVLISSQLLVGQKEAFIDQERIRDLVAGLDKRVLYYSNEFKVYPQLVFPCGTTLESLTFIGSDSTDLRLSLFEPEDSPLDFDIPPASSCRQYKEVSLIFKENLMIERSTFVRLEFDRVDVRAGSILGLELSDGTVLYQKGYNDIQSSLCIPDGYNSEENFPLVAVNFGCDYSATEFLSMTDLTEVAREERTVSYSLNEISVIPALNFSTQGTIFSWTFAARRVLGLEGASGACIQIWRPTVRDARGNNLVFTLVESVEVYQEEKADELVITYELDSAVQIQAGDVVGVKQPENSNLFIMFEREGPTNYVNTNIKDLEVVTSEVRTVMRLPLITPDFHSLQTPSPVTMIPNVSQIPTISLSPSDSTTRTNEELHFAVIVGGILGPLAFALIIIICVTVTCLVWRRKRTRKSLSHSSVAQQPLRSNPVYEAPSNDTLAEPFYIAPTCSSDALYQSVHVARMYEVPITSTSLESNLDSNHTYHVLEASRSPLHSDRGQNIAYRNVYQMLEPSERSVTKGGHEYNEQKNYSVTQTESKADGVAYELFVPSMEQRQLVYDNNGPKMILYESLQKVQSSSSVVPTSPGYSDECRSFWQPGSTTDSLYQQLYFRKFREICRLNIQVTEHIGTGKFGMVKRGRWTTAGGEREVAVKMLPSSPTSQDTIMFLQEAAIMGQFRHPNIVQLLGVVTLEEPLMIVLELLSGGDLSSYLNKNRGLVVSESDKQKWPRVLLGFCQQVAAGLDYLLTKGFVHRDIAARNILLSSELICKISDFGMSRDFQTETYYITHGGEVLVKWTAPEILNSKKYSTASDVWSFGCLMYEIWAIGHKPFEGHTNMKVIKLVERGYRLPPPPGSPRVIYRLMILCWNPTASLRPSSSELLQELTLQEETCLLQLRDEGRDPQAYLLGAPLEAGESLYSELQQTYLN